MPPCPSPTWQVPRPEILSPWTSLASRFPEPLGPFANINTILKLTNLSVDDPFDFYKVYIEECSSLPSADATTLFRVLAHPYSLLQ